MSKLNIVMHSISTLPGCFYCMVVVDGWHLSCFRTQLWNQQYNCDLDIAYYDTEKAMFSLTWFASNRSG